MKFLRSISLLVVLLGISSCASTPQYTQAQLNAIEMREVDANMEETYNAAMNALFDLGYLIEMSDREGGILTGTSSTDNATLRFWINPYIEDKEFTISIQVRELEDHRCIVRIKTATNGVSIVDKEAIDAVWVLMQRQVLMKEPLSQPAQEDEE